MFESVRSAAAELAAAEPTAEAAFLVAQKEWDPFAFLTLCEASLSDRASCELLCRKVQLREWQILFDYCYRQALG